MRYDIKRGAAVVASQLYLEGAVTEKIMGEEIANISFSHTSKIEFHIGDQITIYGKNYFLSADPVTVKKNSREFQYTMVFFSIKYALSNWNVFFYDNDGLLTIPEFSIMGTASTCLDIILTNANRADSGWTKGVVDETEVKNVSFSDANCLEAISKIAEEFKLEYWIDSNKSIHFTERKPVSGYSFEYGKAKGLKDITRSVLDGGTLVTRLYVKGSDKNIPKNYRGGQKNLRIDVPCLEKNIDLYGVKEHTETFSDIYPKRVGTVTAVDPLDPNRFSDADLDFDLNAYNEYGTTVLMNGVAAKIIFQTGQLAGYRIELIEAGGFHSATKTFYLNQVKDEKDMQVPSELLRPAVGDTYIIEDIMMPNAYVLLAENALKTKGQEYLDQNSKERFQYGLESDILYFRNQNVNIQLGATVNFKDVDFKLNDAIRVTGLKKNIQNPFDVKFDLSEVTAVSSIVQSYYEQQEQTTTIINSIKYNAELARRNYLFGREFHDKVFDGEGYFDAENIKPLSIETKMISLGSRLQQFGLPGVNFKLQNNNALQNTAGKIAHQTIDPVAIRNWTIAQNTVIGISNNFNYIYIKCQKIGLNANFVVTEAQIKVEQDADFYHFEVGYLSSVIDGFRKIKTTFGFAQLNPAELSIGRISDPTGNNHIDLLPDKIAIKAKVEFTSDSPAFDQVNSQIVIGGRNFFAKNNLEYGGRSKFSGAKTTSSNSYIRTKKEIKVEENTGYIFNTFNRDIGNWSFDFIFYDFQNVFLGSQTVNMSAIIIPPSGTVFVNINIFDGAEGTIPLNLEFVNQYIDFKLEKGNKATDWTPAQEDIDELINNAKTAAAVANQLLADIANDNKLTPSDKQSLKQQYDVVIAEKNQLQTQASTYGVSVVTFISNYEALVSYISPLLVNLNTTTDTNGVILRSTFNNYFIGKVNLLKAITDKINNSLGSVVSDIADVQNSILNLGNYVDGAFSDGIISQAESVAIEKYVNIINSEKSDIQNKFNIISVDPYLIASTKASLIMAWDNYDTSHLTLINSISSAIADGFTTPTEKADVDAKFLLYRNTISVLSTTFQLAISAIEQAKIDNIKIGGRNLFAKNNLEYGARSTSSGQIVTGSTLYIRTKNYIKIDEGKSHLFNSYFTGVTNWRIEILFFNWQNNFLGSLTFDKSGIIDPPSNALYFHLNIYEPPEGVNQLDLDWINLNINFKLEKGNKPTDWTPAPEDVDASIATAQSTATNAQNSVNATNIAVSNLNNYIDGAFSDGIIDIAEAQAIEKYINLINTEKANFDSIFTTLYANALLSGSPKSNLNTAKTSFNTAVTALINSINNAIADGKTTPAEKTDVDAKFLLYRNSIGTLQQRIEEANIAIQTVINANATNAGQVAATALLQAQNAQATASATAAVTNFLQTTADGNVVSTGTLQVGSANGSANAGITGVVDRGGNSVRIWAGATYAGKNTANWLMREDGVEEQWFNGVLVRQRGVINGAYVEVWYNLNGQIGKQITFSSDGKILEEWYNEGVLVYQIGQNGIYYVADIPESFTFKGLVDCNVNIIQSNLEFLEAPIRQMMYQKTNDPRRFELRANKNSYLYNAGQNVYSEGNKQYDGFKNSKSKTDNVANRWYAYEILGFMLDDAADSTRRFANVFRTENGKIVQSGIVTVETSGYTFNQF